MNAGFINKINMQVKQIKDYLRINDGKLTEEQINEALEALSELLDILEILEAS
ncbi:hypothetical protein GCM10023189_07060 [Nibrella saemangeumensis]|uniref:Uncharacterized protein n=1 Tax=Nibrella saemangeumensis TaxID=1084526 RepID=A0ABP8MFV7_9BACT